MATTRHSAGQTLGLLGLALATASCTSHPPLPTVPSVDLEAFMGDWFVQAHVPASSEARAFNAVERYRLDEGHIDTTYVFRDGGFQSDLDTTEMRAFVRDERTRATWGMEVFWPFEAEYLIVYLSPDGRETIIGRTARDYAWIMTRDAEISDAGLDALVRELESRGYDPGRVRRVPQRWPDPKHPFSPK